MKRADLVFSIVAMLFSIYLMVKSMELPIGWIKEVGPGGGAFPFWLSFGMLITSLVILVRNLMGTSLEGRTTEIFMEPYAIKIFVVVMGSLGLMIGAIHIVGVYVSVPLFMGFYMRYLGHHTWRLIISICVATPIATFIFFEKLLLILLPKGYTEPFFYIFY